MIRYQLPTGKTVLLTSDQLFNMTDEDLQELIAADRGIEIEDVFSDFSTKDTKIDIPDLEIEEIPEEIKKEIEKDLESDK